MPVIDLSLPLYSGMPVYPGDPEVTIEVAHTLEQHTWELRRLTLGSHTGTHVDAFSHMHAGGKTLEDIPLHRFFGKAVIMSPHLPFPAGVGLFFGEEVGDEIFERLIAVRPPFVGGFISEALQRALLKEEIVTYTDLANLDLLPRNTPFMFYGFPLRITQGDGSPVRAVAVVE